MNKPTDMDISYMTGHRNAPLRRPTDLDRMYPDPYCHWDKVDDEAFTSKFVWAGCILGLVVIFCAGMGLWSRFA